MAVFGNAGPFVLGEDVALTVIVTVDGTAGGTPVPVTGWTGTASVWRRREDAAAVYSTAFAVPTGTDGKLTATLPKATTATFEDRAYLLKMTRTDSGADTVVTEDTITFVA
jgi:hypothetical protein